MLSALMDEKGCQIFVAIMRHYWGYQGPYN
jgi:hypothetical protein